MDAGVPVPELSHIDWVGMRFEISQTTPPYLNRRLQLRMLSFVGLMATIMFTLGVLQNRPRASAAKSGTHGAKSPDSLVFEVHRESLDLKDGEFITPVPVEEIRGQSPRSRMESATADRELFAPRIKGRAADPLERSDAVDLEGSAYRRKRSDLKASDRVPPGDPLNSPDRLSDDRGGEFNTRRESEFDQVPATAAPPAVDDWSDEPVGATSNRHRESSDFIRPIPRHRRNGTPSLSERQSPRVLTDETPSRSRDSNDSSDDDELWTIPSNTRQVRPASGIDEPAETFVPQQIDLRQRGGVIPFPPEKTERQTTEVARARIDKRFLDTVKDNTVGIRHDEAEAYYWLLDHARRVPTANLERFAHSDVQYINLMTEPDRFRGEPVTIEGDLWRLYELDATRNSYGVTRTYEGWVFTGDSGNHPYRIVCTSLPHGIEPGENLRVPVRITGYFFKREGYKSNGGVHVAPTLLARRIGVNPMPNGIPVNVGILPYMIGALMAIGMAFLVTMVGFAISDGRSSRAGMNRLHQKPHVTFSGLHVPEPVSVEDSLKQFSVLDRETPVTGAYGPLLSRQTLRSHAVVDSETAHRRQTEASHLQQLHQAGALQSWSARQQAAQKEIDALRQPEPELATSTKDVATMDELDTDQLERTRSLLERQRLADDISSGDLDNDTVSFSLAPTSDRSRLKHEAEALWPDSFAPDLANEDEAPNPENRGDNLINPDVRSGKGRRGWRRGKSA